MALKEEDENYNSVALVGDGDKEHIKPTQRRTAYHVKKCSFVRIVEGVCLHSQ